MVFLRCYHGLDSTSYVGLQLKPTSHILYGNISIGQCLSMVLNATPTLTNFLVSLLRMVWLLYLTKILPPRQLIYCNTWSVVYHRYHLPFSFSSIAGKLSVLFGSALTDSTAFLFCNTNQARLYIHAIKFL